MAVKSIDIATFLDLRKLHPVLDVRSPGEFAHAHIPSAYSLPLFTDDERKIVGTAYKQQGRDQAIKIGLDYFGPKMRSMVEEVELLKSKTVLVHCWRGGMRSAGIAWLLDLYGFTVFTLAGGYKSFRQLINQYFVKPCNIHIVGGYTGSGKTELLHKLRRIGEPAIDLEGLAFHKGSAFGHLNQPAQPSQEMFENKLGLSLLEHPAPSRCWLEDESMRIGALIIPPAFYKQMRSAPCYFFDIGFKERLKFIVEGYGNAEPAKLIVAVLQIQKRLGGLETKTAINCILEKDLAGAFAILLKYYDKYYLKSLYNREPGSPPITRIPSDRVDENHNAQQLLAILL